MQHRCAISVLFLPLMVAACSGAGGPVGPEPASGKPYLEVMYSDLRTTPRGAPLSYGAAPPIDPTVGPRDPFKRALDPAGNEVQWMWITDPVDNPATRRPAMIVIHGGGFRTGIGGGYWMLNAFKGYAERGYVVVSIEYRIDTTSDCQGVQDYTGDQRDPAYLAKRDQCLRGITAAQQDAQAAVRWLRRHAAEYRVDPGKIAVGGSSAGAITAANLAYNSHLAGDWRYAPADNPRADSRVQAAFGFSGCNYDPTTIGAGDAPVSFIHGEFDSLVDYRGCVVPSFAAARAAGLVAELRSYCGSRLHATNLYSEYQREVDAQLTTFLARELGIYSGMRPASADAFCP